MTQAEPFLLGWLGGADARTAEQIYNALAVCGSRASLKPLAAAAAEAGYGWITPALPMPICACLRTSWPRETPSRP